ncbi:protein of unknown function DUF1073 [Vibrio phage 1.052.A._10N.286.46.C3]|nr:protein of unknown function DUF1073 [Vibrio phage 1.052.A._10N.286.46.C3]
MKNWFKDGLRDMVNGLMNRRAGYNRNKVDDNKLEPETLRIIYRSGLMSKVVRLKAGYALNDTIQFQDVAKEEYYNQKLADQFKQATKYMLGFGRGIIVVFARNDVLSDPLSRSADPATLMTRVFSGDIVTANSPVIDLRSERYNKPRYYVVKGETIHHSRVIDLTYFMPSEQELPTYRYGGISETELIYNQIINDGIVERAAGTIVDKASTPVYAIAGFKEALQMKKEGEIVEYVTVSEDARGIAGALIIDKEDAVSILSQSIADLDKVDNITLRRLAMMTGIPLSILVGEAVNGLNATGDSEREVMNDTTTNLQSDYLLKCLQRLAVIFGLGVVKFKENQGQTPEEKVAYDMQAVLVAEKLYMMGEDHKAYLDDKGVTVKNDWDDFWSTGGDVDDESLEVLGDFLGDTDGGSTDEDSESARTPEE